MTIAAEAWDVIARLREARPRVHCITNDAAQAFTADVLLAAGATPSLTLAHEELEGFLASAASLLVNLGTLDERRVRATDIGTTVAGARKLPWVLDPVFVERSPPRLALARRLVEKGPTVVRGNKSECEALFATGFAGEVGAATLAVSGETDRVHTAGRATVEIDNGHAFMSRATAIGCALSALVAACLAVEADARLAATAAMAAWGIAGETAGEAAGGPGTFRPLLIDALYGLDAETFRARARIREIET